MCIVQDGKFLQLIEQYAFLILYDTLQNIILDKKIGIGRGNIRMLKDISSGLLLATPTLHH